MTWTHRTACIFCYSVLCLLPQLLAISEEFYKGQQEVPQPTPTPTIKPPPCRKSPGASPAHGKTHLFMIPPKGKVVDSDNDVLEKENNENVPSTMNCTEEEGIDDGTSSEPIQYDHWKLHIIMACTVTAAVEFLLIIFIILYWRQIRWTLRKITCPCDHYRNRTHEAMEADEEEQTNEFDLDNSEPTIRIQGGGGRISSQSRLSVGSGSPRRGVVEHTSIQRFSAPRNSRVQSATASDSLSDDLAVPGPSGLSRKPASVSPFTVIVHKYSSSDESLSDLEGHPRTLQVSPSTRNPNKSSKGKGSQGKSTNPQKNTSINDKNTSASGKLGLHEIQTAHLKDPLGACNISKKNLPLLGDTRLHSKSDTDLKRDTSEKSVPRTLSQNLLPCDGKDPTQTSEQTDHNL